MANKKKLNKRLIKKITALIESGETNISRLCSLTGISRSVWYLWERSESTQLKQVLSRARVRARQKEDEQAVVESVKATLLLLQGFYLKKTEVKTEFNDDESEKEETTTISYYYVPPCLKTILFVLTNKDQDNWSARFKRHVAAKKGYIYKEAGKAGATVLTLAEAAAIGQWK